MPGLRTIRPIDSIRGFTAIAAIAAGASLVAVACFLPPHAAAAELIASGCSRLSLPIDRLRGSPSAYAAFCRRNPRDCEMSGEPVLPWTAELRKKIERVNRNVNAEIRKTTDLETSDHEELWSYPIRGRGDCEDFALEKRRRLVEEGLPRAALTLALAWHRTLAFSHALLLVETHSGTFVLDNTTNEVACWLTIPFNFEARERPDGRWVHFDQSAWTFGEPSAGDPPPKPAPLPNCLDEPLRK